MNNWLAKVRQFISDTIAELHKCSWTPKDELFESTLLVIVAVLILAFFVFFVDQGIRTTIDLILF
ncbi:MAG: preprotein translocase subunit SecE [Lentisphaerae bacterium GWF2_52_8]|nr:MAG: preprotein translocase subunit SecE [Lentisphaerae bacterium GWF2_52_8]